MRKKNNYREWSEELFPEREDKPIYHGDGTISFVTNCDHVVKGTVVLLYPARIVPCVFCANCGGWIATLKQWQEWDKERREVYKDPFRPKIQLTFSTSDRCLRSFWDQEPLGELNVKWIEYPRARGLFRNLGKKITEAIRENEELNKWLIWNELEKEQKYMSIYIPSPEFEPNLKSVIHDFTFSTLLETSSELLEERMKEKNKLPEGSSMFIDDYGIIMCDMTSTSSVDYTPKKKKRRRLSKSQRKKEEKLRKTKSMEKKK